MHSMRTIYSIRTKKGEASRLVVVILPLKVSEVLYKNFDDYNLSFTTK